MDKIDGLLDGKGYVSVKLVSPQNIPCEADGTVHPDRTRDYIIAEAARASTGLGLKSPKTDRALIRYLYKNRHTSPFEMASITFQIKVPISIAIQFKRHRTAKINAFSQRYSEVSEDMGRLDMRTPSLIRGQSKMNAQSSTPLEESEKAVISKKLEEVEQKLEDIYHDYQELIGLGMCRETARFCLPQSTYTVLVYQKDLNNFMKFLDLRMAPDAQEEIRVYANAMFTLAKKYFPITMEVFEESRSNIVLDKHAQDMIINEDIPREITSKSEIERLIKIAHKLDISLYPG